MAKAGRKSTLLFRFQGAAEGRSHDTRAARPFFEPPDRLDLLEEELRESCSCSFKSAGD